MKGEDRKLVVVCLSLLVLLIAGCTERYQYQVQERERHIRDLNRDKEALERSLEGMQFQESLLKKELEKEKNKANSFLAELEDLRTHVESSEVPGKESEDLSLQRDQLEQELSGSGIDVEARENNLIMILPNRITFDSGSATLNANGREVLKRVGTLLKGRFSSNFISIEGHTDNEPIKKSDFKTNWRLSSERALNVLHFLEGECGIPSSRLRVMGYGEQCPLVPNTTEEGKKKNRRVEIVILRKD